MAFMMPVVKNQYNIYPCRSRQSSTCSTGGGSRTLSESVKSGSDVLSTSPQSNTGFTPRRIRFVRSHSQDSNQSDASSASSSSTEVPTPKSGSLSSLQKFHHKLVDKLRRKFKGKNADDDDGALDEEEERTSTTRSSS